MADHTKLIVWQRALRVALDMHSASHGIRARTAPGLRAQLCTDASSIPFNNAEGAGQPTPAQYARFLSIAIASTNEVESQLAFAKGLGMLTDCADRMAEDVSQIRRMLIALRKRVLAAYPLQLTLKTGN